MVAPLRSIINQALTQSWTMPEGFSDLLYRGGPGPLPMQTLPWTGGDSYGGMEPLASRAAFTDWSGAGGMPALRSGRTISEALLGLKQQASGGAAPTGSGRRRSDILFGARGATGGASGVAAAGSSPVYDTSGALPAGVKASVIKWLPQVQKIAAEYGVPLEMALAVMSNESSGDPRATSAYNPGQGTAKGLYQTLDLHYQPGQDPYDPETNMRAGLRFMGDMYKRYGNDPQKTMAAYFGGPSAIDAAGNIDRNRGDMNITIGGYLDKKFTPALAAYRGYLASAVRAGSVTAQPSAGGPSNFNHIVPGGQGAFTSSGTHGGHPAADIFAPAGTPIYAPVDGVSSPATYSLGGNASTMQGADGKWYYFAHARDPMRGGQVRRGDIIGYVGNTGNARNTPSHLHYAVASNPRAFAQFNGSGDLHG